MCNKDLGALRDIVINANPAQPPLTLLVLHGLLCQRYRVLSTPEDSELSRLASLKSCLWDIVRVEDQLLVCIFFSCSFAVPKLEMKFSICNMCPIEGEANVARFLFKLLAPYPSDPAVATLVDSWVDTGFYQLADGSTKERAAVLRALNSALGRGPWLSGPEFSLADIACYCCLLQNGSASSIAANVQGWMKSCENLGHFGPAKLLLK
ncbi:hypothetical protein XENOCAPTIV_012424 [Xenoophorus captivus]|uniref:AIMP2 thioredoxin-like domain-containing protein n=1 Tax=Xenoophorus captivus TaxID=1517983 RepID=A0ABV0RYL3_9TELE